MHRTGFLVLSSGEVGECVSERSPYWESSIGYSCGDLFDAPQARGQFSFASLTYSLTYLTNIIKHRHEHFVALPVLCPEDAKEQDEEEIRKIAPSWLSSVLPFFPCSSNPFLWHLFPTCVQSLLVVVSFSLFHTVILSHLTSHLHALTVQTNWSLSSLAQIVTVFSLHCSVSWKKRWVVLKLSLTGSVKSNLTCSLTCTEWSCQRCDQSLLKRRWTLLLSNTVSDLSSDDYNIYSVSVHCF